MPVLPKFSFEDARKYPTTLFLLFAIGIAGYFLRQYTGVADSRNVNCLEEKQQLVNQIRHKDSVIVDLDSKLYNLQQQLLIANGVFKALPEKIDSIAEVNKKNAHK